ncbi:monocarboxylate transporter 2-like [Petromyzon marinus]|uniref:Monocarboxylate transporter 2-like n=1 Tax=Petromyzon marinus TaxID=7757 RepID=A0AAJ7TXA0_PETMA|nr:monocarboxylate transporter 2-like [Petromyzon marinus]XP_032824388.1 monocarboxylate transporter 2-like [Petromyzon marinus]XP_032824389.1 monocarboxylate transporter 2-like [Petromyzon marinus]
MPAPVNVKLDYVPPDGGWGWAVLVGSFISIGFSYAFPKAITVFYKEIQEVFDASYSEIAWISSIMLAIMYAGGPISSILVNRFGSRPVVIIGGMLAGLGMIISSFCTSIVQLYICVGVIGGFGLALNLQPALTILGRYFDKRRPMAIGLAMAGSPVVLSSLAPFNQVLFDAFGWRGSFLILAGILFNCCLAGSLMRPIGPKKGSAPAESEGSKAAEPEPGILATISRLLDLTLFRHRGFLIYLAGNVLLFFGLFAPLIFLAPYAKHMGVDQYSAAFLLSILALVDMVTRPLTGILGNLKLVRPRIQYLFSFSLIFNGFCHLMGPMATDYGGLVIYAIFFGIAFGMVSAMLFETLMDLVGAARFSSAVGLVTIIESCPVLLGPPIGGMLVDVTGEYKYMFYVSGAILCVAGIFLFIANFINYRLLDREREAAERGTELAEAASFLNGPGSAEGARGGPPGSEAGAAGPVPLAPGESNA